MRYTKFILICLAIVVALLGLAALSFEMSFYMQVKNEALEAANETIATTAATVPATEAATEPIETELPTEDATVPTEETIPPETTLPVEEVNGPRGTNGVPLYFQGDYPDQAYGIGTVASTGCSITSLAMVATYMTGHEYRPDELARYFGGAAENNIARLELGSETLQLPFKKSTNWHETYAALKDGMVVIALMRGESIFTDSQHFIVLTGLNEEGKIMVNDSDERNYSKWDLEKAFQEGFEEGDILLGYDGAWIYNKSAMPEEPFIYSEPEPVRGECRYDFKLTDEERAMLAKVVWLEARGESNEGQQAVAEVILNRLASDNFPDDLRSVIYAENQFRSSKHLDEAKPYQLQYEMIENAFYGPYVLPEDVYYFATSAKTSKVWGKIGGHVFCYAENG